MELNDLEGEVSRLYRFIRADEAAPPGILAITNGLGINVHWGMPGCVPARFSWERCEILVRRRMSPVETTFWIAHEVAEYWLERVGVKAVEEREQFADALAVRILSPRPAYRKTVRAVGADFEQLGSIYTLSQTCSALRLGEAVGRPVAVVMPGRVLARGELQAWSERELRAVVRATEVPRELLRVKLSDRRGRIALLAA
jgi:hypothetical protein